MADILDKNGNLDVDAASDLIDQQLAALHEPKEDIEAITTDDFEDKTPSRPADEKSPPGEAPVKAIDESADTGDWTSAADVRELIESLGYSVDDLQKLGSRQALDQHVSLMDRQFIADGKEARGKEAPTDGEAKQPRERGPNGRFLEKSAAETKSAEEGDYKVSLSPDEYEEDLIGEIQKSHDALLQRLQATESRITAMFEERVAKQAEAESSAIVKQFDQVVDQLGFGDLFGSAESLTDDAFKARSRLWDATADLLMGMKARGKSAELSAAMVQRALRQEFAKELEQHQRKDFSNKVRNQANRKLGANAGKSIDRPYTGDPRHDPELHAAYNALLENAGAA